MNDPRFAVELTRLGHQHQPTNEATRNQLEEDLRDADPAASLSDNDLELAVLAAAAVVVCLDSRSVAADAAALAISSANFCRWTPVLDAVASSASTYLEREPVRVRELPSIDVTRLSTDELAAKWKALQQTFGDSRGQEVTFEEIAPTLDAIVGLLIALKSDLTPLARANETVREEAEVLWWLMLDTSASTGIPWRDISEPATCLVLGMELAERTSYLPGLAGTPFLLAQAIKRINGPQAKQHSIVEALDTAPPNWLQDLAARHSPTVADLTPILTAAVRCVEVPPGGPWAEAASAAMGLDIAASRDYEDLATQLYREVLLVRAVAE